MASTDERPISVDRVPTLTEVVELGGAPAPVVPATQGGNADISEAGGLLAADSGGWSTSLDGQLAADDAAGSAFVSVSVSDGSTSDDLDDAVAAPTTAVDAADLVTRVLQELAPRIDALFEAQLRDAVAPALARATDALVRDAREDISAALRSLVEQTVTRVLEQRGQG